jgi:hypothetical protein
MTTSAGDTTLETIVDQTAEAGGSVRLFNGDSGAQIGASLLNDFIGFAFTTPLADGNVVINAPNNSEASIANAGSVRLFNGDSGTQIGATRAGDTENGMFGGAGITALANNNFVIVTPPTITPSAGEFELGTITNQASLQLIDGASGTQIGATLEGGDNPAVARFAAVTAVGSSNFTFITLDFVGESDTVSLFNGNNGAQISTVDIMQMNDEASDIGFTRITASASNDALYIVSRDFEDNNAIVDSGRVLLVAQ